MSRASGGGGGGGMWVGGLGKSPAREKKNGGENEDKGKLKIGLEVKDGEGGRKSETEEKRNKRGE